MPGSSWASRWTAKRCCSSSPPSSSASGRSTACETRVCWIRAPVCTTCEAWRGGRTRSVPMPSGDAIPWRASCSRPRPKERRAARRGGAAHRRTGRPALEAGRPFLRRHRAPGSIGVRESSLRPPAARVPCAWFDGSAAASKPPPSRSAAASARSRVQAGYCAVPDFAESPVDAVELLLRATTALRDLKRDGDTEQVRGFEPRPPVLPDLSLTRHSCRTKPTTCAPNYGPIVWLQLLTCLTFASLCGKNVTGTVAPGGRFGRLPLWFMSSPVCRLGWSRV